MPIAVMPLWGDEHSVASEDVLPSHDRGHCAKDLSSQSLALYRRHLHGGLDRLRRWLDPPRASLFVIGRANPPTLELASEDPVLFLNGGDHVLLGPVEPAGQRDRQALHDWNGWMNTIMHRNNRSSHRHLRRANAIV